MDFVVVVIAASFGFMIWDKITRNEFEQTMANYYEKRADYWYNRWLEERVEGCHGN